MCPTLTCRKILAVPGGARGKTVRCKYCNASIRIPGKKDEPLPPRDEAVAA
jgi:LSD1 subclass zinc finger protein